MDDNSSECNTNNVSLTAISPILACYTLDVLDFHSVFGGVDKKSFVPPGPMTEEEIEILGAYTSMGGMWGRSFRRAHRRSKIAAKEATETKLKLLDTDDKKIVLTIIELFMEAKILPQKKNEFLQAVAFLANISIVNYAILWKETYGHGIPLSDCVMRLWLQVNDLKGYINIDRVRAMRQVWSALQYRIKNKK